VGWEHFEVRLEDWSTVGATGFVAAYQLEAESALPGDVDATASGGRPVARVAELWNAARGAMGAEAMILRSEAQTWVAAGNVLIEGKAGLNIGLLMPSLRAEKCSAPSVPVAPVRPEGLYRQSIWGLARRMARVEAARVFLLDTGEILPIHVDPTGFSLLAGIGPDTVRTAIAAGVAAGRTPRFSFGASGESTWGPRHGLAHLFGEPAAGNEIFLAEDGWPEAVPGATGFSDLSLAMTIVQCMQAMGLKQGTRLQVLGAASRVLVSVARQVTAWSVDLSLVEV